MKLSPYTIAGGVALAGAVGLLMWRAKGGSAASLGASAGGAVVDLVGGVVKGVADATGVSSDKNPVYVGVNTVGGAATGNKDFSLGSWLYERFNPDAVAAENRVTAPVVASPPVNGAILDRWDYYTRASGTGGSGGAGASFADLSTPGAYYDPMSGLQIGR